MLSEKYFKAKDIVRNKKFKITHVGEGIVTYLVLDKYHVFYDRRKKLWSCECVAEAWKTECSHILAMKMIIENYDPANETEWKI